MKRRKYKDADMNRIYNGYIDLFHAKARGLFEADGSPRMTGSSFRIYFWAGYGKRLAPGNNLSHTIASVLFAAGKDCAKGVI